MQIAIWLQDIGLRVKNIVEELCEKQSSSFILLLRLAELALQVLMLKHEGIILLLLDNKVLFLLLQLLLHEVNQIIVATSEVITTANTLVIKRSNSSISVGHGGGALLLSTHRASLLGDLCELLLLTLDHFLAEVRTFGKLLFDFFVDFDFALIRLDLLLHFVVLVNEDFCLL